MVKHKSEPLVTFVVLGWNSKKLLADCFDSIKKQTYKNTSTIFVDNGSADGSVEYVQKRYPDIEVIDNGENLGFAEGNNRGIAKALENNDCHYVALLNTDARLATDWTEELVTFALAHPKAAGLQTPTLNFSDHKQLDSRGIKIDSLGRAIQLGYGETVNTYEAKQVFGVNAAAALYSRAFLEAQPFGKDYLDSDLWTYLEDVDLAARATLMGWQNWLVGSSRAYHMGSNSKNPNFSVFLIYRNNWLVLIKNLPGRTLLKAMVGSWLTDYKTLWQLLRARNLGTAKALIKGRFFSLAKIPKFIGKRRKLRQHRNISNQELRQLMKST